MTRVARLLRDEDLDASPANVIESVRLADSLAAIRGRQTAGLDELGEATLSVLCHGNPMPVRLIQRKLVVGQRLGQVPDAVPMVPLQRDLAALQKSLRLKVSADEMILDLDQRKETTSRAATCCIACAFSASTGASCRTISVSGPARFTKSGRCNGGRSLPSRSSRRRNGETPSPTRLPHPWPIAPTSASDLGELTALLDDVILADLAGAVERLLARIQSISAVSTDVGHLMTALPPLARVLRYGNVRKTDAALVEPVVAGLLARISVGLLPACASLDDDAAELMRQRIDGVQAALATLSRPDLSAVWKEALVKVGDAEIHGLVAGRAYRLLLDAGADCTGRSGRSPVAVALARQRPAKASAWLEGFLSGSGLVLVHDERLLGIIDRWLTGLTRETFEQICPIARRTFSTFEKAERRQIGEKIKRRDVAGRRRRAGRSRRLRPGAGRAGRAHPPFDSWRSADRDVRLISKERLERWRLLLGGHEADGIGFTLDRTGPGDGQSHGRALRRTRRARGRRWAHRRRTPRDGWATSASTFPAPSSASCRRTRSSGSACSRLLLEPEMLSAVEPDLNLRHDADGAVGSDPAARESDGASGRAACRAGSSEAARRADAPGGDRRAEAFDPEHGGPGTTRLTGTGRSARTSSTISPSTASSCPKPASASGAARNELRTIVVCIDQSGSMGQSVVYSGIFGAVLASMPALRTHVVAFDTSVADLTDQMSDPVDVLMGIQLGGGTDINQALAVLSDAHHEADRHDLRAHHRSLRRRRSRRDAQTRRGDCRLGCPPGHAARACRHRRSLIRRATMPRRWPAWACRASPARRIASPI